MNDLQIAQQVKSDLVSMEWDDTENLFLDETVKITLFDDYDQNIFWAGKEGCNVIVLESGPLDGRKDRKNIVKHSIEIKVRVIGSGDQFGELVVIGGLRNGGSEGIGLLEFKTKIIEELSDSFDKDGYSFQFCGVGVPRFGPVGEEGVGVISMFFEHIGTLSFDYERPWNFRVASVIFPPSSVLVSLSWKNPARFDLKTVEVYRNTSKILSRGQSGNVALTISSPTTATDSSIPLGIYYWAAFGVYQDYPDGPLKYSPPIHLRKEYS